MLVCNDNGVCESFKRNVGDVLMSIQDLLAAYDEDGRLFFADPEVGMTASWRTEKVVKGTMTMPNMAAVYTSPERVQNVQGWIGNRIFLLLWGR